MNQCLAEADCLRAQCRDARRHAQRSLARGALLHDFFNQTDAQRGRCIHAFARENHAFRPAFADEPRQRLRSATARQQANCGFGQRHHRVLFGDPYVARQRAFQPAAHRKAVDRSDHHGPRILQRFKGRAEARCRDARHFAIAVGESIQIGASTEELRTFAGNDYCADTSLAVQALHRLLQLQQTVRCECVRRGTLQRELRDGALMCVVEFDHRASPLPVALAVFSAVS